jgi:hypothetical protein
MPQQYNIDDQRSVYSVADAENSNYLLNSSDGDGIQPFELSVAIVRRRGSGSRKPGLLAVSSQLAAFFWMAR